MRFFLRSTSPNRAGAGVTHKNRGHTFEDSRRTKGELMASELWRWRESMAEAGRPARALSEVPYHGPVPCASPHGAGARNYFWRLFPGTDAWCVDVRRTKGELAASELRRWRESMAEGVELPDPTPLSLFRFALGFFKYEMVPEIVRYGWFLVWSRLCSQYYPYHKKLVLEGALLRLPGTHAAMGF